MILNLGKAQLSVQNLTDDMRREIKKGERFCKNFKITKVLQKLCWIAMKRIAGESIKMTFLRESGKLAAALLYAVIFTEGINAEPVNWEIDPEHFSLAFEAEHIGYQKQLGFFLEASGEFRFDSDTREFFSGRVEVQANSIFTNNEDRDNHLKGRDFLNSRRHPIVLFEASEFLPNKDRTAGKLHGNLTLLGVTRSIVLDIILNKQAEYPFGHRKETLGVSANTIIDRSHWGMDYALSSKMVGDTVKLRFEFEAIQQ